MAAGQVPARRALATVAVTFIAFLAWGATARAAAPANDDFGKATALPAVLPGLQEGNNLEATKELGEPDHAGNAGGFSVWFSWTPSSSGPVGIQSAGCFGVIDTLIAVYTGPSVGSLNPVASNATATPPSCMFSETPVAEFEASAGTTYWIAVDGRDGAEGTFQLQFDHPPANDDFAHAQAISADPPQSIVATTRLASKESGEPDHAGDLGGHSVWYSWTPNQTEPVTMNTCEFFGSFDTVLAVYTGTSLGALTPVASNDDAASDNLECSYLDSAVTFTATAGTTYRIAVDGVAGAVGRFNLHLQGRPPNDNFASAQELSSSFPSFTTGGSNRFATAQSGEPQHAGVAGGASVWYSWTPAASGPVAMSTCDGTGGLDTLLAVYTGGAVDSLNPVAANDDGSGKCSPRSQLSFDAVASTTYRIAVDGKGGVQGRIRLHIDPAPENDDFAAAKSLRGVAFWFPGSIALATKEAGEPDHMGDAGGHSVWFRWQPTKSVAVDLDVCSQGFEPLLGLYTGSDLDNLVPVPTDDAGSGECNSGRSFALEGHSDTTYWIAVDGAAGDYGYFEMHMRPQDAILHSLSVAKSGDGSGSITSERIGLDCGPTCNRELQEGTQVTLEATPAPGSTFVGWAGGGCSGTGPCQVGLRSDVAVTATFAPVPSGGTPDGGDTSNQPVPTPAPAGPPLANPPIVKPLKCKRGFKKKRVHGKARCVRKHKPTKKHHRHR